MINADQIVAANCFSSKQGSVQKKTEKSRNGQKVGCKNTEIPSFTKNSPPFSVLTTMRRPLLLDAYSAAVKTLESAVNHDWCPNTMKASRPWVIALQSTRGVIPH